MRCLDLREKILFFLIILLLFSTSSGFLAEKKVAIAQMEQLEKMAEIAFNSTKLETDPAKIIGQIIKIILSLMSIILVVLMVAGGFMWMTSGGSVEQITKAKKLMSSALIGLIIVILSYAISGFVIRNFSTVTQETPATTAPSGP